MKKISIVICISILLSIQVYGVINVNDIIPAFNGDGKDIENNIVKGSQYYLTAAGYALQMLAEIEKSSMETLNSDTTLELVNKAKGELDLSLYYYRKALDAAINAKYSDKIANFYNFDYDKFIAENGLNENIAKKVQEYMVKGDIVGLYTQNIRNIETLRTAIISIQGQLKTGVKPDITLAWNVFQKIAETSLFGNYSTLMAKSIFK
jgi:hypothetical protein